MWLIDGLLGLPQFLNTLLRDPYASDQKAMQQFVISSHAISIGCAIAVAIFLMLKADWLAAVVFPSEQEAILSFSSENLQAVLFSAVGLYFLLDGARRIVGSAYQLVSRPGGSDQKAMAYLWQREPEQLAIGVGGVVFGAFVLLGKGRLLSPWKAAKGAYQRLLGLREPRDEK